MVLTIKRRFGIYKRYEKDIWGLSRSDFSLENKVNAFFYMIHLNKTAFRLDKLRRFIYRIDIINPRRHKKTIKKEFFSIRLVKLFFLTLQYRQFRKMAKVAAEKDGTFESNFCLLLEGRLVPMIYRTNFIYSMFEAIAFVREGNVYVNNELQNYVNYVVKVGDFFTFERRRWTQFRYNFLKRYQTGTLIFSTPRYMYINYKLYYAFMERAPRRKDLVYPIKLDIYRATAYF